MQAFTRGSGTKVVIGAVIAAGMLALLILGSWPKTAQSPAPSANTEGPLIQATLKVDGMTCSTCTYRVNKALVELSGVKKVGVSLEKGQAVVEYEESKVTIEQMIEAIKQTGYSAKLIEAGEQGR